MLYGFLRGRCFKEIQKLSIPETLQRCQLRQLAFIPLFVISLQDEIWISSSLECLGFVIWDILRFQFELLKIIIWGYSAVLCVGRLGNLELLL